AGSGSELEESGKSGGKKLDAMTLIKEDMSIFGHCPSHDEFYLVVCNHCSQVVKPQAFQKHCAERRHGPLSKLYARAAATAAKCHVTVNGQPAAGGTPGTAKALREKSPSARGRVQPLPERPDKDNNLWPCPLPATTGDPPSATTLILPSTPQWWPDMARVGASHLLPPTPPSTRGAPPRPPPASRCLPLPAGKECDLNRQCGVLNPDTKKICTRLLTCKIHSVHQRREVQGRAKDFDVLVAELKASSRKERSPPGKEPLPPPQQDPSSLPQPLTGPPSTSPCRVKPPHSHCLLPRARLSSDSDPEDAPAASGEGGTGVFPFPLSKGGSRVSSEESEEEGGEEPPRPPTHPPRPQAFCTFGSRLVSPGCYVFNRRLDRFCSALGSMLERHLSSHMWRKIPPAAEPPLHTTPTPPSPATSPCGPTTPSPPTRTSSAAVPPPSTREGRVPASLNYTVGSPHAAAACSQPECGGGGSQSITSPLPANIPSPSFSKLPSTKASKSSRARETTGGMEPDTRKRKPPPTPASGPPYKRTCSGEGVKSKGPGCQGSVPPGKTKPPALGCSASSSATIVLNGATRVKRVAPPDCHDPPGSAAADPRGSPLLGAGLQPPPPRCASEEEVKKRKNAATYCRPVKPKPVPSLPSPPQPPGSAPPDLGGSVRRKKPGTPLGFEEKRNALKVWRG
ncbi:AT7L2 protein, partial [Atlantisia rogersi]|nr:AT7L2 protein [Atlantisia rogersi]